MFLIEGAKVSKQIIAKALSDPSYTMGIEVEFLLVGAQTFLTKYHTRDLSVVNQGGGDFYVKRLGDFSWGDVLHFMQPLGVSQHEIKDNHEILADRLEDTYLETFEIKPKIKNHSKMWEELKAEVRVHLLMAMMRIFPEHRVMGVPEGKVKALRGVVYDGDVQTMAPIGKVNDIEIATAEPDYADQEYHVQDNDASRSSFYSLVAEAISDKLGVEVTYTTDPSKVKLVSYGYQGWVLTKDPSLDKEEVTEDVVGCELVSPVMSVKDGITMLLKVLQMLNGSILGMEVVTTENTGLHVNIGTGGKEVDALKLLVLLGDEHMLQKFQRETNPNAGSIRAGMRKQARAAAQGQQVSVMQPQELIGQVQEVLSKMQLEPDDIRRLLVLLNELKPEGKNWSVNFMKLPEGYVEFRAIGNAGYEKRGQEILQALHQMLMVVVAATDESVYRKEFLKKLYQMVISPEEPQRIAASVGTIGHQAGMPGGYGAPIEQDRPTPFDGENYVQLGFDPGSDTQ